MAIQIGTSGWSYPHWNGVLYPSDLPPARRLAHYIRRFQTAELNASFYRWPSDAAFATWSRLPNGFTLSVKAPRGLTHGRRLYEPEVWLARIARSLQRLGARRGVLLVQLPPTLSYDREPQPSAKFSRLPSCPGQVGNDLGFSRSGVFAWFHASAASLPKPANR